MNTQVSGDSGRHILRLFITGATPRSTLAISNLRKLLEAVRPERYDLEIIDIYQNPEATRDNQVIAAPTLIRLLPKPVRRIVGDLSNRERVLAALDFPPALPNATVGRSFV